jgi:hypothetical protein
MKTTKGENTMNIEKLDDKVKSLLDETESKMNDLIDKYNESISKEDYENLEVSEVDTVDLSSKFDDLKDYVSDYSS